jgi:putative copper resistance protein D
MPDTLSAMLRSASFVALFQTSGMAIFLAMFGRMLQSTRVTLSRIARMSAIAAMILVLAHFAMEAARMADAMTGIVDMSLQTMALNSVGAVVVAIRLLGLGTIAIAVGRNDDVGVTFIIIGAVIVTSSFILFGHTAASPLRWVLAPLLMMHVTIVAFWFGALIPLYLATIRETPQLAGQVTQAFSQIAGWLVPLILAAGSGLALILVRHVSDIGSAYGLLLMGKIGGFCALMGLAAMNKSRLGPAVGSGDENALRSFRTALKVEYVLISAVLATTAVMTTFYSPER